MQDLYWEKEYVVEFEPLYVEVSILSGQSETDLEMGAGQRESIYVVIDGSVEIRMQCKERACCPLVIW